MFSHLSLSQSRPGVKEQEDDGTQTIPERSRSSGGQDRDENSNIRAQFQEGMARTSRILKEGLRHPAVLKEKESWTKITIV